MIPKRRKRPKMGVRVSERIRSPEHLKWIREQACIVREWHFCLGEVQACHVRTGTGGGMGIKPGDNWTIPLCAAAHRFQHNVGEREFERRYPIIDMKEKAKWFWAKSPARIKLERKKP